MGQWDQNEPREQTNVVFMLLAADLPFKIIAL